MDIDQEEIDYLKEVFGVGESCSMLKCYNVTFEEPTNGYTYSLCAKHLLEFGIDVDNFVEFCKLYLAAYCKGCEHGF